MIFTGLPARYILVMIASLSPLAGVLLWAGIPSGLFCLALLASLVIGSCGVWLTSWNFNNSLIRLEWAIEKVARGSLSTKVYPSRSPQLARLANGLNAMTSQLRERVGALTRLSGEQEAILRTMAEGVITIDPTGHVMRVNRAAREILGIVIGDCDGRLIQEVVHHSGLQEYINCALIDPNVASRIFVIPGAPERTIQAYSAPLIASNGDEPGILFVLQDITRIESLERIRRDFVANVSHELKTPITAIKGFIETLLDGAKDDPLARVKFLGIIGHQADRLQGIVTDLLTLARLESQGYEADLEKSVVAVSGVVQAALRSLQHRLDAKQASVMVQIPPDLAVIANSSLLQQAVTNLVSNAIEYSGEEPHITINGAQNSGAIRISVSDRGPGIEKAHIPRLFERFYRVDTGRSRSKGGTGLGLAIVKHIVQVHRGSVEVESLPGSGTTFAITLPTLPTENY